jgi:hypothetical protein
MLCTLLTALVVGPGAALAQTGTKARDLGAEGLALYEKGDYARALERFDMANGITPAPTLGIRAARCLAKLGRLVEASERYLEVTRFPLTGGSPAVHVQAVQQARTELDALAPTIPTLDIEIDGSDADEIEAKLDGVALPRALLGQPQPLDPGTHRLQVRTSEQTFDTAIALKPGDRLRLWLPAREKRAPAAAPAPRPEVSSSALRTWGIATLVVGGAGAMMGVFNGALALAEQDALEARCPDRNCPPEEHAAADRYDVTRVFTTVGLALGGVGLAVGTTLMLVDPGDEVAATEPSGAEPRTMLSAWIGANGIGLGLRF